MALWCERPDQPDRQRASHPGVGILRLVTGLKSALRQTAGRIFRWRWRRNAIRELQALRDHQLADIGLDRSQIVSTVEKIVETGSRPA